MAWYAGVRAAARTALRTAHGLLRTLLHPCTQLCGQQYGRTSLLIHIGSCQKKWMAVEGAKLPRERRPLPPPPPEVLALPSGELPSSPQVPGGWRLAAMQQGGIC
jgi:hypothetical protein